jgi:hypothetical protein
MIRDSLTPGASEQPAVECEHKLHRSFRFSLRSLFVLITLCAVASLVLRLALPQSFAVLLILIAPPVGLPVMVFLAASYLLPPSPSRSVKLFGLTAATSIVVWFVICALDFGRPRAMSAEEAVAMSAMMGFLCGAIASVVGLLIRLLLAGVVFLFRFLGGGVQDDSPRPGR